MILDHVPKNQMIHDVASMGDDVSEPDDPIEIRDGIRFGPWKTLRQ